MLTAPFVLFIGLMPSVIAVPSAEIKPECNSPTCFAAPQRLRTVESAANGTHGLQARGLRIQFGETNNAEVVWAFGDSQCAAVVLTSKGLNPCGRPFSLHGVGGLTLEGCGGGLWVNQNGGFYESCAPFSEPDFCGVHTEWTCL
ncbi:hypothetical protein AURDEDRAFT_173203 [Auricularia subglabra TFB-10046 SS5]|uniref:Uncharacterized protein n=1 Tax=Auricularia subglabra (strain TFB-10046 / SS5) TaxID=717982 RepID=J0WW88_AURST|nr:hypothetical protein AURDEDRAFT_173203 [Auricularia subglabra TFB-10046 SS5]